MANRGLANMTKRIIKRLSVADQREKVLRLQGQIFIWHKHEFIKKMTELTGNGIHVRKLTRLYRDSLKKQDKKMLASKDGKRLKKVKIDLKAGVFGTFDIKKDDAYAVLNYRSVQEIKRLVGKKFNELTGKEAKLVTGSVQGGDQASKAPGWAVGHGEYGQAVSTTQVSSAQAIMRTQTSVKRYGAVETYQKIEQHIQTYKKTLNLELELKQEQHISSTGRFKKTYTALISDEDAAENWAAGRAEQEALRALRNAIEGELANIPNQDGSDSLVEGVTKVLTHQLTKAKGVKHKKGQRPAPVSKSKGRATRKGRTQQKTKIGIIKGTGVPAVSAKKRDGDGETTASTPLHLIGLINKALPEVVKNNMRSPALVNRTGRFANSVRLTDIIQTPRGYPSFGYTYQKDPYEVFEMGAQGSAPWATPDRDPRFLIDKSIREIAAQFAIGRFYTRRE